MSTSRIRGRPIPPSLAPLVAEMEADRAKIVRRADIARALDAPSTSPRVRHAIEDLRAAGWLAPLAAAGTFEFMPAAGGPFRIGDRWAELRAAQLVTPALRAQVGLGSAAFMRSLSAYQADPEIVFLDRSARVPAIERTYKVIHVVPNRLFGADLQDGILVSVPERIVIEAAVWWQNAGDLREPDHWLSRVVQVLDAELVRDLLARMNASVAARTAYLIDRFGRADLAEAIGPEQFAGVAWIGRRDAGGARFHPKWRVYDSVGVAEP